jgi:hypothetical protein
MELREVENDKRPEAWSSAFAVFPETYSIPSFHGFGAKKQSFLKIDFGAVGAHRSKCEIS